VVRTVGRSPLKEVRPASSFELKGVEPTLVVAHVADLAEDADGQDGADADQVDGPRVRLAATS
jgi:hypothetical protein